MINQLKIKNFKCHTDSTFELNNLTILAGGNASGKSSFIQSLLLLKKGYDNADKKQLATSDIFGLNLGLPENIRAKDHIGSMVYIGANDGTRFYEVVLKLHDSDFNPMSFAIENFEEIIESYDKENFNKKMFAYINAERSGPRITSEIDFSDDLFVGSRGEFVNYIISKMDRLQRSKPAEFIFPDPLKVSEIARFSANCQEWLGRIIPGTELKVEDFPEFNISNIRFKNYADFYVPTATGFGITYVLPIIAQGLIQSMLDDTMLIVENPEAHLHPFSQSQIGKFLALLSTCGVQVVVETHSEHIINGCRLQLAEMEKTENMNVIFFERKEDGFCQSNIGINKFGELERWPVGFFDQSKQDLRKLLEKRLVAK